MFIFISSHSNTTQQAVSIAIAQPLFQSSPLQQNLRVLAEQSLFVIARNIVELNAITVNIMKHGQTRLVTSAESVLRVVRLRDLIEAGVRPRIKCPSCRDAISRWKLHAVVHPIPIVRWVELVVSQTPRIVTNVAGCPNVIDQVIFEHFLHSIEFFLRFNRNRIHAVLLALASCFRPRVDESFSFSVASTVEIVSTSDGKVYWSVLARFNIRLRIVRLKTSVARRKSQENTHKNYSASHIERLCKSAEDSKLKNELRISLQP